MPALLVGSGVLFGPSASTGELSALCLAGFLTLFLRRPRLALSMLCFGAGALASWSEHQRNLRADEQILADHERFTELVVETVAPDVQRATGVMVASRIVEPSSLEGLDLLIFGPRDEIDLPEGSLVRISAFLERDRFGRLIGRVKSERLLQRIGPTPISPPRRWNQHASRLLTRTATSAGADPETISVLQAILLGRDETISNETRTRWRLAGIYHLLVFSGMQIAMAALILTLLLRPAHSSRIRDLALLAMALIAPLFAGSEPSVTRAGVMLGVFALSRVMARPASVENLYFVAAGAWLLAKPSDLTHPGFALTYAAAGGLIFIGKPIARRFRSPIARAAAFSAAATISTGPFTVSFFNEWIPLSAVTTLLAGPSMATILVAGLTSIALELTGLDSLASLALQPALLAVGAIELAGSALCQLLGTGFVLTPPSSAILVPAIVVSILIAGSALPARALLLIAIQILLIAPISPNRIENHEHPHLAMLDVGQGDAFVLTDGTTTILYDSGGRRDDPDFARRILLPELRRLPIESIELAILSHPDADHCSAMPDLIREMEVPEVWLRHAHRLEPCAKRLIRETSGVVVHPRSGVRTWRGRFLLTTVIPRLHYKKSWINNGSLGLAVTTAGRRILLTGDWESDAESTLASEEAESLKADILKVAHHGSKSSTTLPFLQTVDPSLAMISAGRHNPFGHPTDEVVGRLRKQGVVVKTTPLSGTVVICLREGRTSIREVAIEEGADLS